MKSSENNILHRRYPTGGSRVTSGQRLLETRPVKLSVNLLLVSTTLFILLFGGALKIAIHISPAALWTRAANATDFKALP
jgi:hypothetical protein